MKFYFFRTPGVVVVRSRNQPMDDLKFPKQFAARMADIYAARPPLAPGECVPVELTAVTKKKARKG